MLPVVRLRATLVAALTAALIAAIIPVASMRANAQSPAIGRRIIEIGRDCADAPECSRHFTVTIYYRADGAPDRPRAPLATPREDEIAGRYERSPAGFFAGMPSDVFDQPTIGAARTPLVLFMPDARLLPFEYLGVITGIVESGYTVAAVSHHGNGPDVSDATDPAIASSDLRLTLDTLADLNQPIFAGRLDLSKIAAVGHGLGGAAVHELAVEDHRIDGVVDLDDPIPSSPGRVGTDKPLLVIASHSPNVSTVPAPRLRQSTYLRIDDVRTNGFATELARIAWLHPEAIDTTQFGALDPTNTRDVLVDAIVTFLNQTFSG
jgi:hypothetical protein